MFQSDYQKDHSNDSPKMNQSVDIIYIKTFVGGGGGVGGVWGGFNFFFNTHVDTAPPPPWKALSWVPGPGKCRHICLRVSHKARLKARNGHTHVYI